MLTNRIPLLGPLPPHHSGGALADYWTPLVAPLAKPVRDALLIGNQPAELFSPVSDASSLLLEGYQPVETGWTITSGGDTRVFCLTPMPGVTPDMMLWWMAWHGSEAARYRLWHPRAHVSAAWADGGGEADDFVGRTSLVTEYIGASLTRIAIRFVPPSSVGLDEALLAQRGEAAICARVSLQNGGPELTTLIHHLRPTADGIEMRSRFWILGESLTLPEPFRSVVSRLARLFGPAGSPDAAQALLVHCAEEMAHLATFLPTLHREMGSAATESGVRALPA